MRLKNGQELGHPQDRTRMGCLAALLGPHSCGMSEHRLFSTLKTLLPLAIPGGRLAGLAWLMCPLLGQAAGLVS